MTCTSATVACPQERVQVICQDLRTWTEAGGAKQMNGKRHTPEQIIHKLRQVEVELGQGSTVPQVCKKIGVTEQTC